MHFTEAGPSTWFLLEGLLFAQSDWPNIVFWHDTGTHTWINLGIQEWCLPPKCHVSWTNHIYVFVFMAAYVVDITHSMCDVLLLHQCINQNNAIIYT